MPDAPATATAVAATVIAGGPTAIAQATAAAGQPPTATPVPRLQVTLGVATTVSAGSSIDLEVRVDGPATSIAAFNFDIVYDQRLLTFDAPTPDLTVLNTPDRQFQCNLPAPSGDVDPDPTVGRARLVCFSYGGTQASAPNAPLVLARITLHAVAAGQATLTFENTAVFTPDAKNVTIAAVSAQVTVN